MLVICKTLGLFDNTLSADDKYSFGNTENLVQPICFCCEIYIKLSTF